MILLIWTALSVLASGSYAAIHWVEPGQSIQTAITIATDGDTVLIREGEYFESSVIYDKLLTIASEFILDGNLEHIAQTVIIGDSVRPDTNSCFAYIYGESEGGRLVGLTLQNGCGTPLLGYGYAIGGNVCVQYTSVSIERCDFRNGSAELGGGLAVVGEFPPVSRVNHCSFDGCRAEYWGGGIYTLQCSLEVANSAFFADTAGGDGGGICAITSYLAAVTCDVQYCYAECCGGITAADCWGYVRNSSFVRNGSGGCPTGTHLAVAAAYYPFRVSGCTFRENEGQYVPVWFSNGDSPMSFVGNVIEDNTAMFRSGILVVGSHVFGDIAYNIIRNNTSISGGAISAVGGAYPRVHHNVFDGNMSVNPDRGAVVYSATYARPTLDSNIIVNHAPPMFYYFPSYPVTFDARNNWWGHETGPYHPTLNPGGQGDSLLNDSVLFIPWLTEPPDTTMPPGYLGVRERPEIARTWQILDAYPNPFNQSVTLVVAGFANADFEISLYNLLGQVVDVVHRGALTGGQLHYQAPPWLASGVYLLSARDKSSIQTRKVVLLK